MSYHVLQVATGVLCILCAALCAIITRDQARKLARARGSLNWTNSLLYAMAAVQKVSWKSAPVATTHYVMRQLQEDLAESWSWPRAPKFAGERGA